MEIMKLLQFLTGFLLFSDYGNFPLLYFGFIFQHKKSTEMKLKAIDGIATISIKRMKPYKFTR